MGAVWRYDRMVKSVETDLMDPGGGVGGGSSLSYKSLIKAYQISPTPGKTVFIS
jgi:hypothetical protein